MPPSKQPRLMTGGDINGKFIREIILCRIKKCIFLSWTLSIVIYECFFVIN